MWERERSCSLANPASVNPRIRVNHRRNYALFPPFRARDLITAAEPRFPRPHLHPRSAGRTGSWAGTWTKCFRPFDRSRSTLDRKIIRAILGYRHRPIYPGMGSVSVDLMSLLLVIARAPARVSPERTASRRAPCALR